jgi:hypothetical protein
MDAGAVGPWSFGTACELLFGRYVSSVSHGHRLARVGDDVPVPRSSAAPYDHRTGRSRRASAVWLHAGGAIKCRPQAAAGGHYSKLGRQIAVNLKADAHFDKCRSCP